MKKSIALLLSASLAFSTAPAAFAAAQTTFEITTDTKIQVGQVDAYKAIVALFPSDDLNKTDLAAVKAKYVADFQADVQAVNKDIDAQVIFTLDAAIAGTMSKGQAKQAVDKGLQWYIYNVITNLTKGTAKEALVAGDKAKATVALEQAIELYAGILAPTAGKRDNYYATNYKEYNIQTVQALTTAVEGMQAAVTAGDVQSFNIYRQMFDKTLIKVFHLASLKYAKTAPAQADDAVAKIELTEGYFFFAPIHGSLSGGSKADADAIKAAFAGGDKTKVSEAAIKQQYAAAFNGKVAGYVTKSVFSELPEGKFDLAAEHAFEGSMFLAAQEVLIKEKLGAEAYTSAVAHAEQFYKAVVAKNAKSANEHAVEFLKILAKLDGVVFKVGEKSLTVDGEEKTVEAASYINAKTSRTLVPTRFIAQALGATVDYDPATRMVKVVKGTQTIELKLESDQVIVNGEVKADLKLDQTVVVTNDFSYIPLRAVAELFGNSVFYANGEVVITE